MLKTRGQAVCLFRGDNLAIWLRIINDFIMYIYILIIAPNERIVSHVFGSNLHLPIHEVD